MLNAHVFKIRFSGTELQMQKKTKSNKDGGGGFFLYLTGLTTSKRAEDLLEKKH